jgi:membrane-bound metal-dependent hydrolase YbcI (DUF457 family)
MQTYSHLLITAVFNEKLNEKGVAVASKALLLGSVTPDIPLILITIGFIAYTQFINPADAGGGLFMDRYDQLYFTNPYWIASHNLFHAPLLILLYGGIGFWRMKNGDRWGKMLFWFAIGCGLHSTLDIFTHVHDGPVLFFPFDWRYRFSSPVSYWDPEHGGNIFAPLEHLLDVGILIYLFVKWRRRKAMR